MKIKRKLLTGVISFVLLGPLCISCGKDDDNDNPLGIDDYVCYQCNHYNSDGTISFKQPICGEKTLMEMSVEEIERSGKGTVRCVRKK